MMTDSAKTKKRTARPEKPMALRTASSLVRSRTEIAMVLPVTRRSVKKTTLPMVRIKSSMFPNCLTKYAAKADSVSSFETKTETESAFAAYFVKQFGNIELLILTIGSVVFFTLLLVTGNTMAISVRERTSELAVLKAIGFSGRAVLFFVLAESVVIALVGGFLGLTLAYLAIPVIGVALTGLLPPLILSKSLLTFGLGFALLVGAASGLLPGIGAMRMRVVNALRRV